MRAPFPLVAKLLHGHEGHQHPYLPTLQIVVHNASLSNRNHGRRAGYSPSAAPASFGLRPSLRTSVEAIKYRSASIA